MQHERLYSINCSNETFAIRRYAQEKQPYAEMCKDMLRLDDTSVGIIHHNPVCGRFNLKIRRPVIIWNSQ